MNDIYLRPVTGDGTVRLYDPNTPDAAASYGASHWAPLPQKPPRPRYQTPDDEEAVFVALARFP